MQDSTSEFDSILDEQNGEKEEPMDDHDSETETEIKDDDNDNFEEESEDEDAPLAENIVTPGSFKIVDSIVCLGTEPDKAMVNLKFLLIFGIFIMDRFHSYSYHSKIKLNSNFHLGNFTKRRTR